MSSTLHKLETFEIIRKVDANSDESEEEMVNEWLRFSKSDLIEECIRYLTHVSDCSNIAIFYNFKITFMKQSIVYKIVIIKEISILFRIIWKQRLLYGSSTV